MEFKLITNEMIVILLALMSSIVLVDGEELSDEQCREIGYNRNELWCDSCVELEKFEPNLKESCMKCCKENVHAKNKKFAFARLEYCECNIANFPQVKAFIRGDMSKKYSNLNIKFVRGITPRLKLIDSNHNVIEELNIAKWDTDTIQEFLAERLIK